MVGEKAHLVIFQETTKQSCPEDIGKCKVTGLSCYETLTLETPFINVKQQKSNYNITII